VLRGKHWGRLGLSPAAAYAILDGLFQQALLHYIAGRPEAAEDLRANVVRILGILETPGCQPESAAAGRWQDAAAGTG
jgi:hypothetical protein